MNDYIKREDAINTVRNTFTGMTADTLELRINGIPSADVAPVRHGRWEVIDAEEPRRYGCSKCKRLSWHMENYCPNCGAKMDGERKDNA